MPRHLQRQIDKLKEMLLMLGGLVERSVRDAIEAVEQRRTDLGQAVIDGDSKIDSLEIDLEEECLHTLALYQPVAFDLRFVVAVLKINNDLERIGDLAVNLAEQACFLAVESSTEEAPFDLAGMGRKVQSMLNLCLDAMVNIDTAKAEAVRKLDDQVDAIHRGMYDRVTESMRRDPHQLEQMVHFLNTSRQLERIADHAVNIAEDVLYMAEGEILRHRRREEKPAER